MCKLSVAHASVGLAGGPRTSSLLDDVAASWVDLWQQRRQKGLAVVRYISIAQSRFWLVSGLGTTVILSRIDRSDGSRQGN